ncbi:MAG: T9SS type B sorting domain-containing protein [Eudoraea sp.]
MRFVSLITLFSFLFWGGQVCGQVSTDCANAIPICNNTPVNGGTSGFGVDDFLGLQRSGCLEPTSTGSIESNSAWYKFRTSASGQLGFNIGFDTSEDWDFALYRATNCNDLGDPIRCNFFDNSDEESFMGVGEDPSGNSDTLLYEAWLEVQPGEDYYLMINNYSNDNTGFSIQFSGDVFTTNPYDALDCSIINNLLGPPIAACDTEDVILDATIPGALSYSWYLDVGNGFNEITSETSATFQVAVSGMYRVDVMTGPTSNIISDVQVAFYETPYLGLLSDETLCFDTTPFNFYTKEEEALDGQDPSEVLISFHLTLDDAILGLNALGTNYTPVPGSTDIFVRASSIVNPFCFDASEQFEINVLEAPVLDFPSEVFICENSSQITIGPTNTSLLYNYLWNTGELTPQLVVSEAGTYTLSVSTNSFGTICTIEKSVEVIVSETPRILEIIVDDLQTNNRVELITNNIGNYQFQIDDGPLQGESIFTNIPPGLHQVSIMDLNGCGSITEMVTVIGFLSFFTPNGDGINDSWYLYGIDSLEQAVIEVYDRYGKLLKILSENELGWNGTYNGKELPSSDYWFKLSYLDIDGERVEAKYIQNHFALKR